MDQFMYNHQDFIVVASAGNDGNARGTIRSPGTAKSVITVGASENLSQLKSIAHKYFLTRFSSRYEGMYYVYSSY